MNSYMKLTEEARKLGYTVSSIRPIYTSRVNHTRKIIEVKRGNKDEVIYEFCHELGHCVIHGRIKNHFLNEVFAWIIGIRFMKKSKYTLRFKYFSYALDCLRTHYKRGETYG